MRSASFRHSDTVFRLLVLTAFIVVAYLPSFHVPFVFDDVPNILLNPRVQPDTLSELPQALDARGHSRPRPIPMLTFALNYLQGGLDPTGYHATNLLIHVLNAFLVFALVTLLARAPRVHEGIRSHARELAFAGALLWAVHPVNTQAVTYIVQRMASMATLFYLAGLLAFAAWRSGRLRGSAAGSLVIVAYAAAMLSKANTVTLPAAIVLLDVAFFSRWRRGHTWAVVGIAGLAAVAAVSFDEPALTHFLRAPANRNFSGLERLLTEGRVTWHYLSLIAWPAADRLKLDYNFPISRSLFDPVTTAWAWAGLLAITALAIAGLRRATWVAFGWLFFGLALSVESSFILLEIAFEHRLYLPTTLFIPALVAPVYLLVHTPRAARALQLGVLLVAGVLAWQTIERNSEWADFGGFWVHDLERGASPDRVTINGAVRYLREGRPAQALALLGRTEQPTVKALEARAETLMALGRYDEAIDGFAAVLKQRPHWTRAAYYAGLSMVEDGRLADAEHLQAQMADIDTHSTYAIALAANIDQARNRPARGAERIEEALARPGYASQERIFLRLQLGNLYVAMNQPGNARAQYRKVVERNPQQWVAWASLYHLLKAGGSSQQAAAIRQYMQRSGIDPDNFR